MTDLLNAVKLIRGSGADPSGPTLRMAADLLAAHPLLLRVPERLTDVPSWHMHIPFAFWCIDALRPRLFVELGTHKGDSYSAFCQAVVAAESDTLCYAVDTWQGDPQAGLYGDEVLRDLEAYHTPRYDRFSTLIRSTFDEALSYFADGSIDLLHIDGLHTYEAVRHDFESWRPKLSGRGVVLFHDINVREREFGVWRFWDEVRQTCPGLGIPFGHGLGVLAVGPQVPPALARILDAPAEEQQGILQLFHRLGRGLAAEGDRVRLAGERDAALVQLQTEALEREQVAGEQARLTAEHARLASERQQLTSQCQQLTAERDHLRAERDQLSVRTGEQDAELAQARAALEEMATGLAALEAELEQARKDQQSQDLLRSQAQSRQAARQDILDTCLRLMESRNLSIGLVRQKFQQARSALAEQRQRLEADLADARRRAADLQQEVMRLSAHQAGLAARLQAVEQSTTWRATAGLRSAMSGVPADLRLTLRRMAKLGWWVVTPHRMPERLRFLRARKAEGPGAAAPSPQAVPAPGAAEPAYLSFEPRGDLDMTARIAPEAGRYGLVPQPGGYVYVPPRRPDDVEERVRRLAVRPVFSIVVPLYNTPPELFQRMLASVEAQWYPHWQLILVDDNSPDDGVRTALAQIDDTRVATCLLPENKGISGATNAGLALATGDYIVFLDHDDELTEDCLYELALRINQDDPDFLYSDEDKIAQDGRFTEPFFKPDWSPDTMMSTMYTCHVSCVRRRLVEAVGGLRSAYDGSQDYDFILRVVEQTDRIAHIPKILYHWRIIPQSVASDINAKPYAIDAAKRAREAALQRRGLAGALEPVPQLPGYHRVNYFLQGAPPISIIIPSKNNGAILKQCIDSIQSRSGYRRFEIVVMDNGSTAPATLDYLDSLSQQPEIKVIRHDAPFNYAEINNIGVRHAGGDLLLFLNDDTEVRSSGWLERLGGFAQLAHVGAVGAKLLYPGTRAVQHSGIVNLATGPVHAFLRRSADDPCYFARNLLEYNWVAVTGACLMIERAKFDRVGGFDETFPVAYNDVELGFRLVRAGLYNVVCPGVELIHHESYSRGPDDISPEKRRRLEAELRRLYMTHPTFFQRDPFHNPNLDQTSPGFAVAGA
ncbi:glycosyltransferase [Oleisolibacter albus]|uniref:glycosyltransferase n=1 Tax=Oleisolibacter albus TaxID=2171757 RepID=UPI001960EE37|nr:glycosyltransferase [Oleisolibacter albus]